MAINRTYGRLFFALALSLTACAAPSVPSLLSSVQQTSTQALWLDYRTNQSPIALTLIETELVLRGDTSFAGSYVGQRTSSAFGKRLYDRQTATNLNDDRDCSDFSSSAAAQRYFIQAGGPISDPNDLDRDGDGLACEWGAQIRQIAQRAIRPTVPVQRPRRVVRTRCYTGPRGGTYTITASGSRNYNGC